MGEKGKQWSQEEIELLKSIKMKYKYKKWKLISKNFFKKGLKRTQHECRHKWVNCLDPQINHNPWNEEQLQILYSQYQKNHSQWSMIQKFLPRRTQIKIKNHFYGVLRNLTRCVLKYFKKSLGMESEISNRINPNQFQSIYNGEKQYSFLQDLIKKTVSEMHYKFDKKKLMKLIQQNEGKFYKLNTQLLKKSKKSELRDEKKKNQYLNIQINEISNGSLIDSPQKNLKSLNFILDSSREGLFEPEIKKFNSENAQLKSLFHQCTGAQNYYQSENFLMPNEFIIFVPVFTSDFRPASFLNLYQLF